MMEASNRKEFISSSWLSISRSRVSVWFHERSLGGSAKGTWGGGPREVPSEVSREITGKVHKRSIGDPPTVAEGLQERSLGEGCSSRGR